ncbi:uncharacterized protein LOC114719898 isoform X2 [Neltuma alba]|uniref:uncharacterized protein LOC114719898 isoform X2 n=1 Tax=Neltuma alba TaxID=207710 RepID=UPI0010A36F7E|nr:uncharacterized protein LOC114719898 isoform X2 [Prosopis alba]
MTTDLGSSITLCHLLCQFAVRSQDSLADPPYFQRARREKMTRSLSRACANESSDELMLSKQPLKTVKGGESNRHDMSMRTHDESECLSDIDDLEIDRYLHNEEERQYKKIIWEKLNWEYTKDQAAKEEAAKRGFDGLLVTRELDTSASASVAKSQKGKKKRQTQVAKGSGSARLDPKDTQALRKKRLGSKVNFEMMEKLFGEPDTQAALENPKKARIEPCSGNRDNLESELEDKDRGDDKLESTSEVEEETGDMGGLYENTCYDNHVDEGYNYEDDDYNFE